MRKFCAKQIQKWLYLALLVVLCAVRLLIAHSQRVYLLPQGAGIDDMLMIRAAQSITEGNWLGAYGGMAIAKHMGFALWLALLHTLGVPVLLGNAALWIGACGFAVWCLRPVFTGRLGRVLVFAFLAFQPVSFAFFTQRVYRDAIFPALCLAFFAGILGLALRLCSERARGAVFAALGAGFGLAGAWLVREDGIVLLAFAVCALALVLLFVIFNKNARRRVAKVVCAVLPFVVLLGSILGFSAANQQQYGVFMVSDLNSGNFPRAYGAMVAVSDGMSGRQAMRPVSREALERMYEEVPLLALLQEELEGSGLLAGFGNLETGEYGGSFYFALRLAADYAGLTPTGEEAQNYWAKVTGELYDAIRQGRLPAQRVGLEVDGIYPFGGLPEGTVPIYHNDLFAPTAAETGRGFWTVMTFADCNPRPAESVGPVEEIEALSAWLHSPVQEGYVEGTGEPYYNVVQKACFLLCDVLVWLYRVAVWPLLALALFAMARALGRGVKALVQKRGYTTTLLWGLLLLGLLLSFVLRLVVAAYMEVAAFGVGTAIMYLSAALPPLLLFCAGGVFKIGDGQLVMKVKDE